MNWESGIHTLTLLYTRDNRQGPSVEHRELYSVLYDSLCGESLGEEEHAHVCVCSVTPVVSDSTTPWTAARQAPLSMGFFRQECHAHLQGIFPTQRRDPRLSRVLHGQAVSSPLGLPGKPEHACTCNTAQPHCCVPETDTMLEVNHTSTTV